MSTETKRSPLSSDGERSRVWTDVLGRVSHVDVTDLITGYRIIALYHGHGGNIYSRAAAGEITGMVSLHTQIFSYLTPLTSGGSAIEEKLRSAIADWNIRALKSDMVDKESSIHLPGYCGSGYILALYGPSNDIWIATCGHSNYAIWRDGDSSPPYVGAKDSKEPVNPKSGHYGGLGDSRFLSNGPDYSRPQITHYTLGIELAIMPTPLHSAVAYVTRALQAIGKTKLKMDLEAVLSSTIQRVTLNKWHVLLGTHNIRIDKDVHRALSATPFQDFIRNCIEYTTHPDQSCGAIWITLQL